MKDRSQLLPRRCGSQLQIAGSSWLSVASVRDQRIRRGLEILQTDPKVSLDAIASQLNLSASRFRHLFKKELGISPILYLRATRMKQARTLLEGSFLRVKEVAAHVGINDLSHFVRDYKAFHGQTPSQTRASFATSTDRPRIAGSANK
jgi:transcriptional regulator GlxA family with amidase domain